MQKKTTWGIAWLCFCLLLAAVPLHAQNMNRPKAPVYTYVAEWAVPRAQWADMEKLDDQDRAMMDKLVADGIIIGYGAYTNLLHQEGEFTHGSWFSSTSEGNLLKALEMIYQNPAMVTSPVQAASKHWDQLLVDRNYGSKPGRSGGYLIWSQWEIKPGEGRSYGDLIRNTMVPALEKLLADGTITSYGFDAEDYHENPIGTVYEYVTIPDAASLDKVNKAFEELFSSNPALGDAYQSMVKRQGHRDFLTRLRYMVSK